MSIFEKRCEKAQKLMAEAGIDFLFIGGGTDMKYMTDYSHGESERLALFVARAASPARASTWREELPSTGTASGSISTIASATGWG